MSIEERLNVVEDRIEKAEQTILLGAKTELMGANTDKFLSERIGKLNAEMDLRFERQKINLDGQRRALYAHINDHALERWKMLRQEENSLVREAAESTRSDDPAGFCNGRGICPHYAPEIGGTCSAWQGSECGRFTKPRDMAVEARYWCDDFKSILPDNPTPRATSSADHAAWLWGIIEAIRADNPGQEIKLGEKVFRWVGTEFMRHGAKHQKEGRPVE